MDAIVRHAHPVRILLFGSRACGNYASTSDIDIAVDSEAEFFIEPIVEEIRTLLKLDIVRIQGADIRLSNEIASEGILLYDAGKNSYAA